MKTYTFRTKMILDKNVSRTIEVAGNKSLYQLAEIIVDAYGFDFDHAFGFYSNLQDPYHDSDEQYELFVDMEDVDESPGAQSVERTKIDCVWQGAGDKMLFLFDYGDDWRFMVELVGVGEKEQGAKYPRVVKSVGKAPEQYPDEEYEN